MNSPKRRPLLHLAGLGGAILTGIAIAALCIIPTPSWFLAPVALTINPAAVVPTKICPGGLVDVVGSAGDATTYQGFAAPSIATGSNAQPPSLMPLDVENNAATDSHFYPQLLRGQISTNESQPSVIAGAQSQLVKSEVINGLALAPCGDASTDQWLVGGSTEIGRTSLLFLSNPLDVEAVVALEIFGEKGFIDAPGTSNIIVKPHAQRILSLAAFAPNLAEPVVHVTASGGQIYAVIQQTVTRVVTPSGVDFVQPGAPASTSQIIPGVALTGQAGQDGEGGQVTSDLAPAIRVLLPGNRDAEVTATIIGVSGKPTVIKTQMVAKHTIQLPFQGVPDGIYTVVVTADVPVVASARSMQPRGVAFAPIQTGNAPADPGAKPSPAAPAEGVGGDFAWNASSLRAGESTLIAVPTGPHSVLTLYNSGMDSAQVIIDADGQSWKKLVVPAGASRSLELSNQRVITLNHSSTIHAAIGQRAIGYGSAFTVTPTSQLGSAVTVFPY